MLLYFTSFNVKKKNVQMLKTSSFLRNAIFNLLNNTFTRSLILFKNNISEGFGGQGLMTVILSNNLTLKKYIFHYKSNIHHNSLQNKPKIPKQLKYLFIFDVIGILALCKHGN